MKAHIVTVLVALSCISCGSSPAPADEPSSSVTPSETSSVVVESGVVVTAASEDVLVSTAPLGDVGIAELSRGRTAAAVCFVPEASTNTRAVGSAVQIELDGQKGFVAVEIVDPENGDRLSFLEESADSLRERLPECGRRASSQSRSPSTAAAPMERVDRLPRRLAGRVVPLEGVPTGLPRSLAAMPDVRFGNQTTGVKLTYRPRETPP